jgi:hypothetical protein
VGGVSVPYRTGVRHGRYILTRQSDGSEQTAERVKTIADFIPDVLHDTEGDWSGGAAKVLYFDRQEDAEVGLLTSMSGSGRTKMSSMSCVSDSIEPCVQMRLSRARPVGILTSTCPVRRAAVMIWDRSKPLI